MAGKTPEEIIHELRGHQIELEIQNEELKKAQLDLEDSRNRYLDLYDFSPVGYVTLTRQATILEINLTGATMLGVVRQQLIGSRFRRFVAPDHQGPWDRVFFQMLNHREKVAETIQIVRSDGTRFFSRIEGLKGESPSHPVQVRLAISDISELCKAIEQSDLNSRRIGSLLGLYQQPYLSEDQFLEYVLEGSLKIAQSSVGFIGLMSDDEQMLHGHAWSREVMEACEVKTTPMHLPIENAGVWADSVRLKKPVIINDYIPTCTDGKFLPKGHIPLTRVISVPVMVGDQVVAVIAGANKKEPYNEEDIQSLVTFAHSTWEILYRRKIEQTIRVTERRLYKAEYIAKFGNVTYDYLLGTIQFSEEVYQICGIDRSTWTGSIGDFFTYIHPDDRELVQETFRIMIETGGKGDIEHRFVRPDGAVRWVHVIIEALRNEEGEKRVIEGIILDITARKQAEEERLKAFAQITHNLEVLAILNDEIRNPLAIIMAICDIEPGNYNETIIQAVKDIDGIIDRLDQGWIESEKVRSYMKRHYEY